ARDRSLALLQDFLRSPAVTAGATERSSGGQPLGGQTAEAVEIPILGEERAGAILAAERDDLRVVDQVPLRFPLFDRLAEQLGVAWPGGQDPQAWRAGQPAEGLGRLARRMGRIEQPRMADHARELAQTEDGDRPDLGRFGELGQARE